MLKKFIAVLVFLSTFSIFSNLSFGDTLQASSEELGITVILFGEPCTLTNVRKALIANGYDKPSKALVIYKGKRLQACWIPILDEDLKVKMYGIVDETGDGGFLDAELFHNVRSL